MKLFGSCGNYSVRAVGTAQKVPAWAAPGSSAATEPGVWMLRVFGSLRDGPVREICGASELELVLQVYLLSTWNDGNSCPLVETHTDTNRHSAVA